MLTSLDRVFASLRLEVPDMIPFHAYESPEHAIRLLGHRVHEIYLEPELVPQAMVNAAKKYKNDIIYLRYGPYVNEKHEAIANGEGILIKNRQTGAIVGQVYTDTKELIPVALPEPPVKSFSDIDNIPVMPWREILEMPAIKSLKSYFDEFKGRRFIFGFAAGQSANALDSWLGTENAMIATFSDPGLCRAVMEKKFAILQEEIIAYHKLGVDGIYTGDACASCSFFSPQTYRELFFEYQKKSIDFVHEKGMKALLHICGRVSPILEDMAASGADVIESLDAFSSGGDIELADAKRRVGSQVCLKGNIDAVHVIMQQSPEKIYESCMQSLRDAGPEGYILSTEQITRDTPGENVFAMIQARDDYSAKMKR